MATVSCRQTIRARYHTLTTVEKRIADYILQHGEEVMQMSTVALSVAAETVPSAVIRCCKSLGYSGYSELKLALAVDSAKNHQLNYAPYITPDDSAGHILDKVFAATIKSLHDTAAQIDRDALEKTVSLFAQAGQIFAYGIGTSAGLVENLQYHLMLLGYIASAFTDVPSMKISTMNLKSGDVAVGISHSGRTVATLDALQLAHEAGAKTVCITSYADSPITQICDHSIVVCSDEIHYPVEAMSARIAQTSVIDALTIALSARNYEDTVARAKRSHELVNMVRQIERD